MKNGNYFAIVVFFAGISYVALTSFFQVTGDLKMMLVAILAAMFVATVIGKDDT